MELKEFQKNVIEDLKKYLLCVNRSNNLISAWREYWFRKDINVGLGGVPPYNHTITGVPHVCTKVPTGGGKTFIACSAIKHIFNAMPLDKPKVVVWLVPSDAILTQTIKNLSDVNHPYRQRLDADFAGRVGIYTKDQLLSGQNFSPDTVQEMLTICILSYASLRINSRKKDVRKVYQENGNLLKFTGFSEDDSILLENTPETALIQALRQLYPVVIVDESHNAGSDLSVEMLKNLNPSFILDLTATPRENSNILTYVDARELKKENMVKLPVIVYNRNSRQDVIRDALQLQASIEQQANIEKANGGEYIRPIVLFQAQPNIGEDSGTFDKIKAMLLELGIEKEKIAIKTSEIDEIKDVDLLSSDCKIRYIITINALKEGWDCPFAYILASLANKTSLVDVEQILGRILRQPYVKQHSAPLLNTSYVLTSSNDFRATLNNIVSGLNKAGFSEKDYRLTEDMDILVDRDPTQNEPEIALVPPTDSSEGGNDDFGDISPEQIRADLEQEGETNKTEIEKMLQEAEEKSAIYAREAEGSSTEYISGELGEMLNQFSVQPQYRASLEGLLIPQFFYKVTPDLFGSEAALLEPETLSEGFSLTDLDSQISFELSTGDMYQVDVQEEGEAVPKYKKVSKDDSQFIRQFLATLPAERKIEQCANAITKYIDRNNRYRKPEIEEYVKRVISDMSEDELEIMETAIPTYASKITDKINSLEEEYREKQFYLWADAGRILTQKSYQLDPIITPANTIRSIPKSLYKAERDDLNRFELELIDLIAASDNILCWHRIIDRKGFRLNAFINHYPDFLVMTKRGNILLVEAKGDYYDGADSIRKLKLGRKWQELAGQNYRYFMVFDQRELETDGAYTIDQFAEIIKSL